MSGPRFRWVAEPSLSWPDAELTLSRPLAECYCSGPLQGEVSIFSSWLIYVEIALVSVCGCVWVVQLTRCLGMYNPLLILPMMVGTYILFGGIAGGLFFQEFERLHLGFAGYYAWAALLSGMLCVLLGLALIALASEDLEQKIEQRHAPFEAICNADATAEAAAQGGGKKGGGGGGGGGDGGDGGGGSLSVAEEQAALVCEEPPPLEPPRLPNGAPLSVEVPCDGQSLPPPLAVGRHAATPPPPKLTPTAALRKAATSPSGTATVSSSSAGASAGHSPAGPHSPPLGSPPVRGLTSSSLSVGSNGQRR